MPTVVPHQPRGTRTADLTAGRRSVVVAGTGDDVAALAARARLDRIADGQVEAGGVVLTDGNRAGVGDWVLTRRNQRTLALFGGRDFVKNGDVWTVTARHSDGSLDVEHHGHAGRVRLPSDYVARHVQLAYATTAHRAQGATVDTTHAIVTGETTREVLYVAATRARHAATLYVATDQHPDIDGHGWPGEQRTARQVLEQVLTRTGAERSATGTIRDARQAATKLRKAVDQLSRHPRPQQSPSPPLLPRPWDSPLQQLPARSL